MLQKQILWREAILLPQLRTLYQRTRLNYCTLLHRLLYCDHVSLST